MSGRDTYTGAADAAPSAPDDGAGGVWATGEAGGVWAGDDDAPEAGAMADLAGAFPGWHVWRGRTGSGAPRGWYATRLGGPLSDRETRVGLFPTVYGADADELRAALVEQAEREAGLA